MERHEELLAFGGILFEWDRRKAASNFRKHGIAFAESVTVFADDQALLLADPDHSEEESRFLLVGASAVSRILVVVSVERGNGFASSAPEKLSERSGNSMKKASGNEEQEMRAEYDFSSAVKNPYAKRITSAIHMVVIRPEVFAAFPSEQAVNDALEGLMRSGAGAPPKAVRRRSTPAAAQGVRSR